MVLKTHQASKFHPMLNSKVRTLHDHHYVQLTLIFQTIQVLYHFQDQDRCMGLSSLISEYLEL